MPLDALRWTRLDHAVNAEQAFAGLFGASPYAFWLDSSRLQGASRYSFLGESDDLLPAGFDALQARLDEAMATVDLAGLPPEVACGYVGYFGYELPAYDGVHRARVSPYRDSGWLRADRYLAIDHWERQTWVIERGDGAWLRDAERRLALLPALPDPGPARGVDPEPLLVRDRQRYLADVRTCLDYLRAGESYEICLTNLAELPFDGDPWLVYRRLRRLEPAPHAAFLRLGDLHVLSASPECFLAIDADGYATACPIKGTSPRSSDPATDLGLAKDLAGDVKTQAENLMIVDLLRNDLGRVCEPGSMSVPDFLVVESSATVHSLVSRIRGRLRTDVGPVPAVRACFPPGSMTGAPKVRTMEILDSLETRPRGIYSGVLGYFGLAGTADLSVVIRTAVISDGLARVGAGGAIVLDSDPDAEYAEMLLKAAVPLRAF
ncbi:anthranilate synthase component I family protein [Flindersiella endophytica]